MTFWSGEKIESEGKRLKLVTPFDKQQIDCSAYKLTLGGEYFVTPDYSTDLRRHVREYLGGAGQPRSMVIPAGHFAFLITHEVIKIPDNAMGFISLRSKLKWRGLINVSGFHVDPGYKGKLIYSVFNAGPAPINLDLGQDMFLLWISDIDRSTKYKKQPKDAIYNIASDQITHINHPIHSLERLSQDLEKVKNELSLYKKVGGFLLAVLAVISTAASVMQVLPKNEKPAAKASSSAAATATNVRDNNAQAQPTIRKELSASSSK